VDGQRDDRLGGTSYDAQGASTYFNDGARYDPVLDTWTPLVSGGAPSPRTKHTAIWDGSEVLVWGGYDGSSFLNDTWSYTPAKVMFLYQRL
jgi:N-acetylneuraminic acid mutarotase